MSDGTTAPWRSLRVILTVLITLVVFVVWLVAFWLPKGTHLSNLQAQQTTLESQQATLQAKLAGLQQEQKTNGEATQLLASFPNLIPPEPDNFLYTSELNAIGLAASVNLTSLQVASVGTELPDGVVALPISVAMKGTYSQILQFIRWVYYPTQVPVPAGSPPLTNRLAVIDTLQFSAPSVTTGSVNTSSAILTLTLAGSIFTTDLTAVNAT